MFFHVGKAAGSSIENWLAPGILINPPGRSHMVGWDQDEKIYLQHATIDTVLRLHPTLRPEDYFKFSVVRNPFARLISAYYYGFDFFHSHYPKFSSFIQALPKLTKTKAALSGNHFSSQLAYTHVRGQKWVDYMAYFEELPDSIHPVKERLGLAGYPLRLNTSRHENFGTRPTADFYSPEMVRMVIDCCGEEFAAYGYSYEVDDPLPKRGHIGPGLQYLPTPTVGT